MAHTLTEVAVFTPTITVPDGTDSRADAAEVVAAIAQGVANRSQFLKAVTDNAAVKNAANTFTAAQTFSAAVTVGGTTTLNGALTAADGTIEVTGAFGVTGVVTASDLYAIGALGGASLTVTGPASISGDVSAPDGIVNVSGGLAASGAITAASLGSTGALGANGDASIGGDITLTNATKDIKYTTPPTRWVNVPLSLGRALNANASYDTTFDTWGGNPGVGTAAIRFPLAGLLPRGTTALMFAAVWRAHDVAAANAASLIVNTQAGWTSSPAAPTNPATLGGPLVMDDQFSTTQAAYDVYGAFLPISHTVDNAVSAYYLDVTLPDGPNNRLFGLRIGYTDPGARNG